VDIRSKKAQKLSLFLIFGGGRRDFQIATLDQQAVSWQADRT
jgi:hypothetical protein